METKKGLHPLAPALFVPRRDLIAPKVYVLRCGDFVKIGWATDLTRRMRTIQRTMPYDLTILNTVRGGKQEEKVLHQRYAAHRHRGEWFRIEGALAEWIAAGCPMEDAEGAVWERKVSRQRRRNRRPLPIPI